MISLDAIETTAKRLMAKAAIEIPEDYLAGLKQAAADEGRRPFLLRSAGDAGKLRRRQGGRARHVRRHGLSALVRENGERGADRRRAGRPGRGVAPRHRQRHHRRAATPQPRPSAMADRPQQQCRHQRTGDRIRFRAGRRLDRPDHGAQGRAVRHRLPDAVPVRRDRGNQTLLSRQPCRLRQTGPGLPAGDHRHRAGRLRRIPAWCWASARPVCAPSATGIPDPKIAELEVGVHGNWAIPSAWGRWALSASPWSSIPISKWGIATPAACRCRCMPSACRRAAPWRGSIPTGPSRTAPILTGSPPINAGRRSWPNAQMAAE